MLCSLQDKFLLLTPGGGGYGPPSYDNNTKIPPKKPVDALTLEKGSVYNYRMLQESV